MRTSAKLVAIALAAGAGLGLVLRLTPGRGPELPDGPAVAMRMREVSRLESLDVTLYRKVSFAPEPVESGSLWGDVAGWLRHTFRTPRGKAIVFADAHLGIDLGSFDASRVRVAGRSVEIVLPEVRASVELRPADTEIIGSNLDSADTARLLELARAAFQRDVERDAALRQRARGAAERAIAALLGRFGFTDVRFVERLSSGPAT